MALNDMINYVQNEVHKEIDEQTNRARIEATQMLIAFGEHLEQNHEEELYNVTQHINQKEAILKAEQDYICNNKLLIQEDQFAEELLSEIEVFLLYYIQTNHEEYKQIISSWLIKANQALEGSDLLVYTCMEHVELIKNIVLSLGIKASVQASSKIQAGMLIQTVDGTEVDLTFNTLFQERKQQLLTIVMQMLRED